MSYPYILQGDNISIVIDNKPYNINKTHVSFADIKQAIKEQNWPVVKKLVDVRRIIAEYTQGNINVYEGKVFWKETELHGVIVDRIVTMFKEGFSVEPIALFIDNLMQNQSKRAITELYGFLEKGNMPITPDGCFLAYKRVNDQYMDIHSRSVCNKPAALWTKEDNATPVKKVGNVTTTINKNGFTEVSMPREKVDDNQHNTCSHGLHFCRMDYLPNFTGDRTIIVRINPKDVVSIPTDYNSTKGRCCKYEIVGEIPNDTHQQSFKAPVQENATNVIRETAASVLSNEVNIAPLPKKERTLSMTPNAIKKREKRAKERAQKLLMKG